MQVYVTATTSGATNQGLASSCAPQLVEPAPASGCAFEVQASCSQARAAPDAASAQGGSYQLWQVGADALGLARSAGVGCRAEQPLLGSLLLSRSILAHGAVMIIFVTLRSRAYMPGSVSRYPSRARTNSLLLGSDVAHHHHHLDGFLATLLSCCMC